MSVSRDYPLRCPRCRSEFEARLHDSINRASDPALREDLLANRIHGVECPGCGYSFRVEKNLVYHDPGLGFLVFCAAGGESDPGAACREFQAMVSSLPPGAAQRPALHLALTRLDMVERIFLLEAGLDARLIEYIKRRVHRNNRVQADPATKRILFSAADSTGEQLVFVIQDAATGRLEQTLTCGRAAYKALARGVERGEVKPSPAELFPGPLINARQALLAAAPPAPGAGA